MVSSLSIRKTYLHKKWGVMPLLNLEICYLCPEPVPPSVISREIKNNSAEDNRYQAYWANSRSQIRRRQSRKRERISDPVIREYVIEKLELGWSPRQIAGRIEIDLPGKSISHETIYMYIFEKRRDLTQYLVYGRKNRRKRHQKRGRRTLIPNRTGIEDRPDEVGLRQEAGH